MSLDKDSSLVEENVSDNFDSLFRRQTERRERRENSREREIVLYRERDRNRDRNRGGEQREILIKRPNTEGTRKRYNSNDDNYNNYSRRETDR
ncbi:MAG: hypothetical protein VXZ27_12910, partial [SAR324 cluster bacterium]|nr:hypothetical protein [SAR324 cluster bacterium]